MIAIDSSALVAIVMEEPGHEELSKIIARNDCIIGAPTRFEATMVIHARTTSWHSQNLLQLLSLANIKIVAFTPEHAQASQVAFETDGKGRGHPAQLNFGDCMAYAVAQVAGAPLLYKGRDFALTDIVSAYSP